MSLNFKPLELNDKAIFDKFLDSYQPEASELTFTNLFAWRDHYKYKHAILDNHLLVSSFFKGQEALYQPIGETPWLVIEKLLKVSPDLVFERVEKKIAVKLSRESIITPQREMFDYIYSIDELSKLPGTKYSAKRNFVNQCKRYNPATCILDENTVNSFFSLQEKWCNIKNCASDKQLQSEDVAIKEALAHFKEFNLFGVCVVINKNIEAFAIGEKLNNDTFVEHFEKANTKFNGMYQYVLHEFAKAIPKNFKYLNREEDLGIEGLRKSKLSYNPVTMVEKYRISA